MEIEMSLLEPIKLTKSNKSSNYEILVKGMKEEYGITEYQMIHLSQFKVRYSDLRSDLKNKVFKTVSPKEWCQFYMYAAILQNKLDVIHRDYKILKRSGKACGSLIEKIVYGAVEIIKDEYMNFDCNGAMIIPILMDKRFIDRHIFSIHFSRFYSECTNGKCDVNDYMRRSFK